MSVVLGSERLRALLWLSSANTALLGLLWRVYGVYGWPQFVNEITLPTNKQYLGRSFPGCYYLHSWLCLPLLFYFFSLCPGAQQSLSR